jgi:hypothetical protein
MPETTPPLIPLNTLVILNDDDREPPLDCTMGPGVVPVVNDKTPKGLDPGETS